MCNQWGMCSTDESITSVMSMPRGVCVCVYVLGIFFLFDLRLYYSVPDTSPSRFIMLWKKETNAKGAVFTRACSHYT